MGRRGKVELKKIENKVDRQTTFSKRRAGVRKKAEEISVLCDAEVALIVFSSEKQQLFEYATDSRMKDILERYVRYSKAQRQLAESDLKSQGNSPWTFEYARLKERVELAQRNLRRYLGEDVGSFSVREVHSLEQQLDTALTKVRSRKSQLMNDSICALRRKEKAMYEQNNWLSLKIKEKEKIAGTQQNDQFLQVRSNQQLDLTLKPASYSCHLGCFAPGT